MSLRGNSRAGGILGRSLCAFEALAAGDGADDQKRFLAGNHGVGERRVGRVVREVLLAVEEADEVAALGGRVVAVRAAEHRVARLESIESGSQRDGSRNIELDFAGNAGEVFQVVGDDKT